MRTLLALLALLSAPLSAQTWTVGPQAVTYPTTDVRPRVGDGSTSYGGTPPALVSANSLYPDVPTSISPTGWMVAGTDQPVGQEGKFRTHCNATHVGYFDPIRGPKQKPFGHLHMFFGNPDTNQNSTYSSLRRNQAHGSACGGGPFNRTAYWLPALLKANAMGDGITRIKKPDFIIVYYTVNPAANRTRMVKIPRGLRYILGTNMDDPDDNAVKAEIAAANTAAGAARWAYRPNGNGNGVVGWSCEIPTSGNGSNAFSPRPGAASQPSLADASGNPTLSCSTSGRILLDIHAPQCWDGVNLSSPSGYGHMRYYVANTNFGWQDVCPVGWYELPQLQLKFEFSHQGAADYSTWRFSSDTPAASVAGHSIRNGESAHTDWFGAWDYPTMEKWMTDCNGVNGAPAHNECDNSAIGDTQRMILNEAAPDGSRNPQVNLTNTFVGDKTSDWFNLPTSAPGPMSGHAHGPH